MIQNYFFGMLARLELARSQFHHLSLIREPSTLLLEVEDSPEDEAKEELEETVNTKIELVKIYRLYEEIWDNFDSGNLSESVRILAQAEAHLKDHAEDLKNENLDLYRKVSLLISRSKEMMSNQLWQWIKTAPSDQIGIIAGSNQPDLYELSLRSSVKFLKETMHRGLADMTLQSQIKKYQPHSFFDRKSNMINDNIDDLMASTGSFIQIPKHISPELSEFLYDMCRVINTIAGFDLNRSSILESLKLTVEQVLEVYQDLSSMLDDLDMAIKRRRAMQLYFDLLFMQLLLNSSKNFTLIEKLNPRLDKLARCFEAILDPIEFYSISDALHSNALNLIRRSVRLYGLLIPHLQ